MGNFWRNEKRRKTFNSGEKDFQQWGERLSVLCTPSNSSLKAEMATVSSPDSAFAFNNPVYCDWEVAITTEKEGATAPRSRKRQKKVQVAAKAQTFLVSSVMLAKYSEYFRLVCKFRLPFHYFKIRLALPGNQTCTVFFVPAFLAYSGFLHFLIV